MPFSRNWLLNAPNAERHEERRLRVDGVLEAEVRRRVSILAAEELVGVALDESTGVAVSPTWSASKYWKSARNFL